MKKNIYLVLHSHFYQPPREDPWSGEIEFQKGAAPFKNWNERITAECYIPNSKAKVVNAENKLINIVNNYKYYNFNFGPTLLNWIKDKYKLLYKIIIDGDQRSQKLNRGFGNAIAQVYNHIILPLADYEDKRTQIIWGIEDFKNHFNREPVSIWLAETAIDYDTVDVLVEFENLKYIILSPFQAEKIRKNKNGKWIDVSNGSIYTNRAYKLYSKKYPDKYINVFFYNGDLSHKISFENLLTNADLLYKEIVNKIDKNSNEAQIISVATDGETYGHHHKFGEITIGYLVEQLLPSKELQLTNFENYLDLFPADYEVVIKGGEGSSWSCSHGVGRWYKDCGCKINANNNWNQKWRTPLRKGLNIVRDNLRKDYIYYTNEYFFNPMEARNDYINILINRTRANIETFFSKHLKKNITDREKNKLLKLLEIQKYSMYMFTSCAWFFDDITDVATVQILKYAAWAIFLNKEFEHTDIEKLLLNELAKAKSNIPDFKNGKWIYLNMVKPYLLTFKKIINFIVISKYLDIDNVRIPAIYEYSILKEKMYNNNCFYVAEILIKNKNSRDEKTYFIFSKRKESLDFNNIIVDSKHIENLEIIDNIFFYEDFNPVFNKLNKMFKNSKFSFEDLDNNEAKYIIELFINKEEMGVIKNNIEFFEKHNKYIHYLTSEDIIVDVKFRLLLSDYFSYFLNEFSRRRITFNDIINNQKVYNILRYSKDYDIKIDDSSIKNIIKNEINNIKENILKHNYISDIEKLIKIFEFCKEMKYIDIIDYIQEEAFYLLNKVIIKRIHNLIGKIKFEAKNGILKDKFFIDEYTFINLFFILSKKLDIEVSGYEIYIKKLKSIK